MKANLWASLLISLFLVNGCATTPTTAKSDPVENMHKVNNFDGLIDYYQKKVEQNPDDLASYEQIALAYFKKNDLESAEFYSDYLLERGYESQELLFVRGKIYASDEEPENAIEFFNQSIASGNNSGDVFNALGVEYSKLNQFSEAIDAFNTARLRGFDELTVKNNLAVIYIAQGNNQKAISVLTALLEEVPENKKVRSNLAIALLRTGDMTSAKSLLKDDFSSRELVLVSQQIQSGVSQ